MIIVARHDLSFMCCYADCDAGDGSRKRAKAHVIWPVAIWPVARLRTGAKGTDMSARSGPPEPIRQPQEKDYDRRLLPVKSQSFEI
jgi:hypothetical protein